MRFVIYSPDYAEKSAGISALHRLCHWLTVFGHDASLTCSGLNPDWETRYWNGKAADAIAVYPEIVEGNPIGGGKVVRWALSHPGYHYFGSPAKFEAFDLACCYAERHRPATEAAASGREVHRLFVSVFDHASFFPAKYPKMHDMFYIGRGRNVWDAFRDRVDLSNAVEFPGGYPNRFEVGKALRRVGRFFMFDQVGALLAEAMLCGAQGIFVAENGDVIECQRDGLECMGVFEENARFDQSGDVENFIKLCERL